MQNTAFRLDATYESTDVCPVCGRPTNDSQPGENRLTELTPRQKDVAGLLVQGMSNGIIARRLSVTESTVKNHLHALYRKLGVETRTQAVLQLLGQDGSPS